MMLVAGLLVPVTAFARVLSICNMSGRVGKTCCCHRAQEKNQEKECHAPAIDRAPCCTQVVSHADKAAATTTDIASDVPAAALLEQLPSIVHRGLAFAESERIAARARAPPPLGPPLYLLNCAILS